MGLVRRFMDCDTDLPLQDRYNIWVNKLSSKHSLEAGIDVTHKIMNHLGNVQDKLRIVHVAGTNGKGSVATNVARAVSSIAQKHSSKPYRVGLFTSPHILTLRERFSVNNDIILVQDFVHLLTTLHKKACDNPELRTLLDKASFFSMMTIVAFLYFYYGPQNNHATASRQVPYCDLVLLEVGIGGRLDATNVIRHPLCSIITSIGWDHVPLLGHSLQAIAAEKGGIIKHGCSVVLGHTVCEFKCIDEIVHAKNAAPVVKVSRTHPDETFADENHRIVLETLNIIIPLLFCKPFLSCPEGFFDSHRVQHTLPLCRYWVVPVEYVRKTLVMSLRLLNVSEFDVMKRPVPIVCLDIGHNEPAIDRVSRQFKIQYGARGLRVLCCLSTMRSIGIFKPILYRFPYFKHQESASVTYPALYGMHYVDIVHPRTTKYNAIMSDYDKHNGVCASCDCVCAIYNVMQNSEQQLSSSMKDSAELAIPCGTFEANRTNRHVGAVLPSVLLQCYYESSNLLCIGSSFMMKDILKALNVMDVMQYPCDETE